MQAFFVTFSQCWQPRFFSYDKKKKKQQDQNGPAELQRTNLFLFCNFLQTLQKCLCQLSDGMWCSRLCSQPRGLHRTWNQNLRFFVTYTPAEYHKVEWGKISVGLFGQLVFWFRGFFNVLMQNCTNCQSHRLQFGCAVYCLFFTCYISVANPFRGYSWLEMSCQRGLLYGLLHTKISFPLFISSFIENV